MKFDDAPSRYKGKLVTEIKRIYVSIPFKEAFELLFGVT